MNDWLIHPAVQAGVAPFIAALVVAMLLRRSRFIGLAIVAAFAAMLALTIGFSFESLTSTRKLVLVALAAAAIATGFDAAGVRATRRNCALLASATSAAGVWVVLRVLLQQDPGAALLGGAASAAYMAALVASLNPALGGTARLGAAVSLLLGGTAGVIAVFGASAWLAQAGISLAVGAAAVLLVLLVARVRTPARWSLLFPVTVGAGLICLVLAFTGELPWYGALPPLVLAWLPALASRVCSPCCSPASLQLNQGN